MSIRIAGTGSYVPERRLTNFDLERMVETSDEWIRTRTGIEERRIAAPEQATSDLAYEAAKRALEAAGITPQDLSIIAVGTVTPDHVFPSTACILQHKLGAAKAMCFDLEAACTGLLYSMDVVRGLMKLSSKHRYGLVIGAEKLSSIMDWEDRNTCVLFGDGASALVLEQVSEGEDSIVASSLSADGAYTDILQIPAGGSRIPASAETVTAKAHCIHMVGKDVFKLAVNAMVGACREVLEESGVSVSELKWLIPHQANYRIIKAVGQRLDIEEERVYVNVNRFGNTSAATIGICLDEMVRAGQLQRGDLALLTAFGGGLTWGATLLRW